MSSRVNTIQAADYIPCAKSTLDKLRVKGGGPRFIKLGKKVLYDVADLDAWLEEQKRGSTSDQGNVPRHHRKRRTTKRRAAREREQASTS